MMSREEAAVWFREEAAKIRTLKDAKAYLKDYNGKRSYFESPAGQTAAREQPHMRQARHDLADWVREKFNL